MYYFINNPKFLPNKVISYFNCDAKPPWEYSFYKYWGYPLQRDKDGPLDFPLLFSVGEIISANVYNKENPFKMDIENINLVLLVTTSKKIMKKDPGIPRYIKNFPILGGAVYYLNHGILNILYMATHPLYKGGGTVLLNYFKKKYNVITLDSLRESQNFYIKNAFRRKNTKNDIYKEFVWFK
jgi:hypothetical protein